MESDPNPTQEPEPARLLGGLALSWHYPVVTEIPRKMEPVDKDTFIEGLEVL